MNNQEKMFIEKEAKNIQAEYHRNWRANNREKVKEINKKYWLNKAKEKLKVKKGD